MDRAGRFDIFQRIAIQQHHVCCLVPGDRTIPVELAEPAGPARVADDNACGGVSPFATNTLSSSCRPIPG